MNKLPVSGEILIRDHIKQEILTYCGQFLPFTEKATITDLAWRLLKIGRCFIWISGTLDAGDADHPIKAIGERYCHDALGLLHIYSRAQDREFPEIDRLRAKVRELEHLLLNQEGQRWQARERSAA